MAVQFNKSVIFEDPYKIQREYEKIKIGDKVTARIINSNTNSVIQGYVTFISLRGFNLKLTPIDKPSIWDLESSYIKCIFVKWYNFISLDEQRNPEVSQKDYVFLQEKLIDLEVSLSMREDDNTKAVRSAAKLANTLQDIFNIIGEDEFIRTKYKSVERIIEEYKDLENY